MSKYNVTIPDRMNAIISKYTASLAASGALTSTLGFGDLAIVGTAWTAMTVELAHAAGSNLSEQTIKKIAMAVLTGAGTFIAGTKIATAAIGWITAAFTFGTSLIATAAANSALNAAFTRSYGRAAAKFFLTTERISSTDMAVKILIALVGADYGFSTPYDDLLS